MPAIAWMPWIRADQHAARNDALRLAAWPKIFLLRPFYRFILVFRYCLTVCGPFLTMLIFPCSQTIQDGMKANDTQSNGSHDHTAPEMEGVISHEAGRPRPALDPPINGQRFTILIADDDPGYCALLRFFFEDEGWNVITAATAETLKQRAVNAQVLLVDVKLSSVGRDGITAVAALRQSGLLSLVVPVVFFSGLDQTDCKPELRSVRGGFLWLRKPCLLTTVLETVKRAMKQPHP